MKKLLTITFAVILFAPLALMAADNKAGFDWMNNIVWPALTFIIPILLALLVKWVGENILKTQDKKQAVYKIAVLADDIIGKLLIEFPNLTWLKVIDEKGINVLIEQMQKQGWANGNAKEVAERALAAAYVRATGPGDKPDWVENKPAKAAKK